MTIDVYSLCPGGSGKKIKFCCPDFLPELEKIERLMEGEQFAACLEHIQRLQAQPANQDRACLMAYKADVLQSLDQQGPAMENAKVWVEKHPDNSEANAELATLFAMHQGGKAAMPYLQKAISLCGGAFQGRLRSAMSVMAQVLRIQQEWLPIRPLLNILLTLDPQDMDSMRFLASFNHDPAVPLQFREAPTFMEPPADAPWKDRFNAAFDKLEAGRWQEALADFESLLAEAPEAPALWDAIANARGWLLDTGGCCEALRKFSTLDVPLDDAVHAMTLAMLLSDDPLGDNVDLCNVSWNVGDCDHLWERVLSTDRAMTMPADRFRQQGGPMPRGAFALFGKGEGQEIAGYSAEPLQDIVGLGLLFGRQTDREARVEFPNLTDDEAAAVRAFLEEIAPGAIQGECVREVIGQISRSTRMLRSECRMPAAWSRRQRTAAMTEMARERMVEQWPKSVLGILGGRTIAEAAAMPEYRVPILAAILFTKGLLDSQNVDLDMNVVRASLGLPLVEAVSATDAGRAILRPTQIDRVKFEELSDTLLETALRSAMLFNLPPVILKAAKEVVARPTFAGTPSLLRAYEALSQVAESEEDALRYISEGLKAAEAAGQPTGSWHLLEMYQRIEAGDSVGSQQLFEHIYREHAKEPGVAEALTRFLVEMGALRPDGTPNPQFAAAAQQQQQQSAAQPSGLWTPESQQPSTGGGKLWTPD